MALVNQSTDSTSGSIDSECRLGKIPVSILYKSILGRYRPVSVHLADGSITARCSFIKNARWVNGSEWGYLRLFHLTRNFL